MDYRFAGKVLIVLFCLFHMAGIASYAMPDYLPESMKPINNYINTRTRGYVLATSQWQKWNLFSPDPLRRVVSFHIDAFLNNEWVEVKVIGPGNVEWWHRSRELKVIRRLDEEQNLGPLREQYLRTFCVPLGMSPGTQLRLRKTYFVIPMHEKIPTVAEWRAFVPENVQDMDVLITCES